VPRERACLMGPRCDFHDPASAGINVALRSFPDDNGLTRRDAGGMLTAMASTSQLRFWISMSAAMAACGCSGGSDGGGGSGGGTAAGSLASASIFVGISGPQLVGFNDAGKKAGSVDLDTSATSLDCDGDAVWFLNAGLAPDQAIYRFDPESGKVDSASLPDGTNPMDLSIAEGALWTVTGKNQLIVSDPSSLQLEDTVELKTTDVSTIDDYMRVAAGLGGVWVTSLFGDNQMNVLRVDPQTHAVAQNWDVGDGHSGVAVGAGAVWVTTRFDATVTRIDPSTNQPSGSVAVGGDLGGSSGNIAVGAGAVWVLDFAADRLVRIDPAAMSVAAEVTLSGAPDAVAAGKAGVWVLLGDDKQLVQIDTATNTLGTSVTLDDTGYALTIRP
jgi:streptogramin lyase